MDNKIILETEKIPKPETEKILKPDKIIIEATTENKIPKIVKENPPENPVNPQNMFPKNKDLDQNPKISPFYTKETKAEINKPYNISLKPTNPLQYLTFIKTQEAKS